MAKLRLVGGLIARKVAGQTVLVPAGKATKYVSQCAVLNKEAAYMVSQMNDDFTIDDIVKSCLKVYNVEEDILRKDVVHIVEVMKDAGMIVDDGPHRINKCGTRSGYYSAPEKENG